MRDQETARKIILHIGQADFSIADVALVSGYSAGAIRNLISRGVVTLAHSQQRGRGSAMTFAFDDILAFIFIGELSRLGVAPTVSKEFVCYIQATVMHKISEIAGVYGEKVANNIDNFGRYAILCYSESDKELIFSEVPEPMYGVECSNDISRIVIDCEMLAQKAISAFIAISK